MALFYQPHKEGETLKPGQNSEGRDEQRKK